jgi:hypothetical protein
LNAITNLPATLASVEARLPATYTAAQKAIAQLERVDECRAWADKAAALASYARQARDDTLRVMAVRIQARAERRCGELLKQIAPANGARTDLGTVPTRGSAAEGAGLSERQRKTALRIAAVPERTFEAAIEAARPPTITQLAHLGTQSRGDTQPSAELGELRAFARFCSHTDAASLAGMVSGNNATEASELVGRIDAWLDRFMAALSG